MFSRDRGTKTKVVDKAGAIRDAIADAADAVVEYADPLAKDEKLREQLAAAIVAGAGARNRMRRQTGWTGLARRLAADPVLRAQIVEMAAALQAAHARASRTQRHRARNTILFLAGVGMTVAAVPQLRERASSLVRRHTSEMPGGWNEPSMPTPSGDGTGADVPVTPSAGVDTPAEP
jgi:hypothetical protein